MAEAPPLENVENEPVPSSSKSPTPLETIGDDGPLPEKRRKLSEEKESFEKLELRIGSILCCAVCLDLPQAAVYQCTNGHLMCAPCFAHLLADARLRDEPATCPNCRVEISRMTASRNLAVEKTVSELPSECKFCSEVFPRHTLQHHEDKTCESSAPSDFKFKQIAVGPPPAAVWVFPFGALFRIVSSVYWLLATTVRGTSRSGRAGHVRKRRYSRVTECKYSVLGCLWRGPARCAGAHAAQCALPARSDADLLRAVTERDARHRQENALYLQILDLLSFEKITLNDIQLKPYRMGEFVQKLYYETSRFSAFEHQWLVKALVNKNQRDPTQSAERELSYQVILKSRSSSPLSVQWLCLRGPYGAAALRAALCAHSFSDAEPEAPHHTLPLADPADANRLLADRAIHFRLIMFLSSK